MKDLGIKNIITGVFVVAALAGFMVFSGAIKIGSDDADVASGNVVVWGNIPFSTIQPYIDSIQDKNLKIQYVEKKDVTYESDLVNALASNSGPDLFIMPHQNILRHRDKSLEIPFSSFPKINYEQTYIDAARIFLTDTGVTAFPMTVDPLVMYHNKALISSAFLLSVPEYWDEFIEFTPQVTKFSGTGEVTLSGVGMGTYRNLRNAKALISTLILQNNNAIVGTHPISGEKQSFLTFDQDERKKVEQALDFYTSFSRFGSSTYSWNEALSDSGSKFIAGDLAIYFGQGSEAYELRKKNPNLDFGVTLIPQVRASNTKITHGSMVGIAISKQTKNVPASLLVASKIAGQDIAGGLADRMNLAPARKDLLANKPEDELKTLIFNSAIISRGWLDADPDASSQIFLDLIRNINTGASQINDAIDRASADLNIVLDRTINSLISS